MFLSLVTNLIKNQKIKKNKDKFVNDDTSFSDFTEYNTTDIFIMVINLICFIIAMNLFVQCKKLKKEFDGLEFLAAFCYPFIYVIYRLIFKPEEYCEQQQQFAQPQFAQQQFAQQQQQSR